MRDALVDGAGRAVGGRAGFHQRRIELVGETQRE
jgi:hypothetical protein